MLTAAGTDRILGSWGVNRGDPNDQYGLYGDPIGARGEWLYDNDPIAHAIVETILAGSIGPTGLQYRSLYQEDDQAEVSKREQKTRRKIEAGIASATKWTRFDAGGRLSRPDMSKVTLSSTINNGDSWSIRCWLPNRPGRQTHATCWRIVHPLRVSNPHFVTNSDRYRDGIELDDNGNGRAIHVQRIHPASVYQNQKFIWDRVPMFTSDGWPNVTHHCLQRHADQFRPVGWFSPVIQLLRLFGRTLEAKTIADTLKSSMGLIVECDNPEEMARLDRNGAVLNGSSKILPGRVYYVRKGTQWSPLNFDYKGEDFDKWQEVVLTNVCAAFGVPFEFVQMKLTRTNMAASRVALMQAYRTFHGFQNDLIETTEDHWNQSIVWEDLQRGRLDITTSEDIEVVDRILAGRYLRPPRPMPDPAKEAQAADVWHKNLGKSLSSIYAENGMDLEDETAQRATDDELLEQRDITLVGAPGTAPVGMPGQQPGVPVPAGAPTPKDAAKPAGGDDAAIDPNADEASRTLVEENAA